MKRCDHCGKSCLRRVAVRLPDGSIADVGSDCARKFKRASTKDIVNSYKAEPTSEPDPCMSPGTFIGRWFHSKKKTISQASIVHWATKYPYTGRAFRFGKNEKGEMLGSWSRSIAGLQAWKMHKFPPAGYGPKTMNNYVGYIDAGIDLVAMIRGEGLTGYEDTIIAVDEVTPIQPVQNVVKI